MTTQRAGSDSESEYVPGAEPAPLNATQAGAKKRRGLRFPVYLALLPVIAIVAVVGTFVSPAFLTFDNLVFNVLSAWAGLTLLVIAQSMIIISGYFDLSHQSMVAFAPMLAVWLVLPTKLGGSGAEINQYLGLAVLLLTGALLGAFNGVLVAYFRLNSFITTLAMLVLLQGLTMGISSGNTLTQLPSVFTFLGTSEYLGLSADIWLAGLVFVGAALFMRFHVTGRGIYAMGGNAEAARAAAIATRKVAIGLYAFGGMMAAVAGLLYTARSGSVTVGQGNNAIFTVFAAAVIGGIVLEGGRGNLVGALLGVVLLGLVQNLLLLSRVPSYWVNAVYGAIILGALVLGAVSERARWMLRRRG